MSASARRRAARNRLRRQPRRRVGSGRRRAGVNRTTGRAQGSLRGFRQATTLAVALTAFLLFVFAPDEAEPAADEGVVLAAQVENGPGQVDDAVAVEPDPEDVRPEALARETRDTALETIRSLYFGFIGSLPRLLVVLAIFLMAWVVLKAARPVLRRALRSWERANASIAVFSICVWAAALGVAVSVLAGDIRALLGSLGLIGLALSWALQGPIESFTGWLLNSFQGYYRVGDRVSVGEVFGDVYRIDFLTTTVWEIGSPERGGFVQAEQPTGRLITFPNNEVLAGSIVNLTRDFPYVWDELAIPVANESDLPYARDVFLKIAHEILAEQMAAPAAQYEVILQRQGLATTVSHEPEIFMHMQDSWTDLTVRYLVDARARRRWKTQLTAAVMAALNDPAHGGRILPAYTRRQVQITQPDGSVYAWTTDPPEKP
jgi:small-conductance mechanosensitive channel